MNKVYIFDVDGTLTPSRLPMTKEFQEFFKEWIKKNKFYLVTGSDIWKLLEQICYFDIEAEGIFTCCGNEFWRPDPHIVNISAELIIPGSYVMLKGLSEPGEVLTSVNTSNEFEVQLGSLRTRVKMELVEQIIKNSKKSSSDKIYLPQKPTAPSEIEVRGQSLDEALPKVESFLDIASRSGHERVRVIHGRGTGAMRIAVRELFDKHPLVLGYQTAELHEGGIGVTVVKLAHANK